MKLTLGICSLFLSLSLTAGSPLDRADELYKKREIEKNAREALSIYRDSAAKNPKDPEILWRLSMAAHLVGRRYATGEDKEKLYDEGFTAGEKAVELAPKCGACYFWKAINRALYGEAVGVFKMIFTLNNVIKDLDQVAELDPKYALGGSFRIRGTIYHRLPGLLGGDDDVAKTFLEKAYEISPNALNGIFLARFYVDEDEFEKARKVIHEAKALKNELDQIEVRESVAELGELEKELPAPSPTPKP